MSGVEVLAQVTMFVVLVPVAVASFVGAMRLTLAGAEDES